MKRVLLTGAAGAVGTMIRPLLAAHYPEVVLSDVKEVKDLAKHETFIASELSDAASVERICEGIDGIIHLGGYSVEGPWDVIHQSNIIGCYNLFEAARKKGVKRVIFASSNHAVGFYPRLQRISDDVVPRPDGRYGVSKLFGEGLGALYAYKHGLRVLSLRIGNVGDKPLDKRRLAIWLRPDDLVQLIRIGLEHPEIRYEVMYGVSNNETCWFDNSNAHKFGYRPKGVGEEWREHAMAEQAKLKPDPICDYYQGGMFCGMEYDGDESDMWR
ncbi:NAD-dependent epimerase/dehydratase family protein [Leptospira interrogans]